MKPDWWERPSPLSVHAAVEAFSDKVSDEITGNSPNDWNKLIRKSYRGFKDFEVDGLGRVNIFAGMNNLGKTTLLEALFWWSADRDPQIAFNSAVMRVDIPVERAPLPLPGLAPNMMPPAGYMWGTAWQPMFHTLANGLRGHAQYHHGRTSRRSRSRPAAGEVA